MSERTKMIVSGYIRRMEYLLKDSLLNLIPTTIMLICYDYYSSQVMICVAYIANNARKRNGSKFGIIDYESNNISKYELFKEYEGLYTYNQYNYISSTQSSHCFIPNISNKLTNLSPKYFHNIDIRNKSYHGIFSVLKQNNGNKTSLYPYISLFKSSNINQQNYFHELTSQKQLIGSVSPQKNDTLKEPNCMLFCGRKHGMIYEWNKELYQLDLSKIKSDNFEFIQLPSSYSKIKRLQWKYQQSNTKHSQNYLTMEYLNNINKIFAIYCRDSYLNSCIDIANKDWSQFGIYDLENKKWNMIRPCQYNKHSNFQCNLCYESDIVYMLTNNGKIALYNCYKNKWNTCRNMSDGKSNYWYGEGIIWIDKYDANILCYGYQYFRSVKISKLDMRDAKSKWIETDSVSPKGVVRLFK